MDINYEELRSDERVLRAEQELMDYLDGNVERVLTREATRLFSRLAAVRLRVFLERKKYEDNGYEDNSGDPRGFNLYHPGAAQAYGGGYGKADDPT